MIPPELAHTLERYRLAYLITVNAEARAHVASVTRAQPRRAAPALGGAVTGRQWLSGGLHRAAYRAR